MDMGYKAGETKQVIDVKGRKRGLKIWTICSVCENGRWVRIDAIKLKSFTGMCGKCHNKFSTESRNKHPRWKGGRQKKAGYIHIRIPFNSPFYSMARKSGYILEHRYVMAKHLNRVLATWEVVHHRNGKRDDNRLKNLELMPNQQEHLPSMMMQAHVVRLEKKIKELENYLKLNK